MDSLKTQMNQMQRQYEQRIEAMEAKMKSLESNANSGSILNTRVLTDANGTEAPGKAPAPILDESFLKSLTRNFTFNMYVRAGFMFNGSGGAGSFNFEVPDNPGGRFRLGNENDFYSELSWSQAHILGEPRRGGCLVPNDAKLLHQRSFPRVVPNDEQYRFLRSWNARFQHRHARGLRGNEECHQERT